MDEVLDYAQATALFLKGNGEDVAIARAQDAAKLQLKDPGSAQFRNLKVLAYQGGQVICGEINAKNSYGGYVGFKKFVASPTAATLLASGGMYPHIDALRNAGIDAACGF